MSNAANTNLLSNITIADNGVTADAKGYDYSLFITLAPEAECYWMIDGDIQGLETRPELIKAMRNLRFRARLDAYRAAG